VVDDLNISKIFHENGVKKDDTIILHVDAGVASQFINIPNENKINHLISELLNYFKDKGTLLVPAFSYSFTEGKDYSVKDSNSTVGLFSEKFRNYEGIVRSEHPIFSMSLFGKNKEKYLNTKNDDCFGPGTCFDMLHSENAKIVCLGCSLDRATFVHYSEQANRVSYRYFKDFKGKITNIKNERYEMTTRYFVRDTSIMSSCSLGSLITRAQKKDKIIVESFGRFPLTIISCNDFNEIASELIAENKFSLIKEGNNEV
jgi:aminoglycoside 3-N-acetyltransferase